MARFLYYLALLLVKRTKDARKKLGGSDRMSLRSQWCRCGPAAQAAKVIPDHFASFERKELAAPHLGREIKDHTIVREGSLSSSIRFSVGLSHLRNIRSLVAVHLLPRLRIHFIRDGHNVRKQQAEV